MPAEPPPLRVIVCKASPIGEEPVEPRIIEITMPFDEVVGPVEDQQSARRSAEQMQLDAGLVHSALLQLPQGTLDRLLILMLEREKTLLRCQLLEQHDEETSLRRCITDALDQLAENTDAAVILRRALETEDGGR